MNEVYDLQMNVGSFVAGAERVSVKLREVNDLFAKVESTIQGYDKKGQLVSQAFQGIATNGEKLTVKLKAVRDGFRLTGASMSNGVEEAKKYTANANNLSGILDKKLNTALYKTASLAEKISYKNAIAGLKEYVKANEIAAKDIALVRVNLSKGTPGVYDGKLQGVQSRLVAVDNAAARLGQQAVKDAEAAAKRLKAANNLVEESNKGVLISWQSLARFFQARVLFDAYQGLSQALQDGAQRSREFSIQVGLIRTLADDAGGTFDQWGTSIKNISNQFGDPAIEVARAAYDALSNQIGESTLDIEGFLQVTGNFSKITGASAEDASNLFSSAINAFKLEATDANRISEQFFKTIDLGRIKASDLANSFGRTAVPAAELGVKMEELNAGLAVLTSLGNSTADAQTQMLNLFNKLIKPTDALKAKLASLGFTSAQQAISIIGFTGVLDALNDTLEKDGLAGIGTLINDLRGFRGTTGLLSNLDRYKASIGQIATSSKETTRAIEEVFKTNGQKLQIEFNRITNFFSGIGDKINSALVSISSVFGDDNDGLLSVIRQLTAAVTSLISGAALGGLIFIAPRVVSAVTAMGAALAVTPIGAAAVAVGALAAGFVYLATQMETVEEKYNRLAQARSKADVAATTQFNNAITDSNRRFASELQAAQRVSSSTLAANNAQLFADFAKIKDAFEAVGNRIRTAGENATSAFADRISDINREMEDNSRAVKKATDSIEVYKAEIADAKFQDSISGLDPTSQVKALVDQSKKNALEAGKATGNQAEVLFDKAEDGLRQAEALQKQNNSQIESLREKEFRLAQDFVDPSVSAERQVSLLRELNQVQQEIATYTSSSINFETEKAELLAKQVESKERLAALALAENRELALKAEALKQSQKIVTDSFTELNRINSGDSALFTNGATAESLTKRAEDLRAIIVSELETSGVDFQTRIDIIARLSERLDVREEGLRNREKSYLQSKEIDTGLSNVKLTTQAYQDQNKAIADNNILLEQSKKNIKARSEAGFVVGDGGGFGSRITGLKAFQDGLGTANLSDPKVLQDLIKQSFELQRLAIGSKLADGSLGGVSKKDELISQLAATRENLVALQLQLQTYQTLQTTATNFANSTIANFNGITSAANATATALAGLSRLFGGGGAQGFASGGLVQHFASGGQAHGSDTIPAMLSKGEFVVNPRASRQFRSQLLGMNSGITRFATGGDTSNINVGDVNVSMTANGNAKVDAEAIGRELRKAIQRGTVRLQ